MDQDFHAIIVGAGGAGLCCAGELVLPGKGVAPIVGFWTEVAAGSSVLGARAILVYGAPRA